MTQHHNDLIRRLRNAAPPPIKGPNLLDEAADRIRQLEAALRKIESNDMRYDLTACAQIARAALETACEHENVSPGGGYNAWCDKCGGMLPASALNRGGKP
jgi:hypothetical protein